MVIGAAQIKKKSLWREKKIFSKEAFKVFSSDRWNNNDFPNFQKEVKKYCTVL